MYVRSDSLDEEIRVTVDAAIEIANVVDGNGVDGHGAEIRAVLVAADFIRARRASSDELDELVDRCVPIARMIRALPEAELGAAVDAVNTQLASCAIAPSLSAHDGFALHIHWTAPAASFAHQIAVDLLMAISQTLCDHGVERFGRCAAVDCERVFFDSTKNRSRRFCNDPRCASRTHTAAHRARHAGGT